MTTTTDYIQQLVLADDGPTRHRMTVTRGLGAGEVEAPVLPASPLPAGLQAAVDAGTLLSWLSHITVDCADLLGDRVLMAEATGAMQTRASDPGERAAATLYQARLLKATDPDQALGQFSSAVTLFERIGQDREVAIARGEIADILQSRGQLDEALALHIERLMVFERLGDIDGVAHTRFASAQLRLGRGDHETGGFQAIYEDLAHSFAIIQKLQRPDGIAVVGMLLAQVLAMGGLRDEALKVLDAAEQGFRTLGNSAGVGQIEALRQQFVSMP